ncbi:MAG: 2-amino-4-hydroxy-6-hydroxymethyldihydropteridine diphosphokinase [Turicibacter sp.]
MAIAYLGLGSNMGDRKKYLHDAMNLLIATPHVSIMTLSSLYETKPWGYTDQDIFMNLVVKIETDLTPIQLLDFCQSIEQELGRVRLIKWGPRVIDVDILLYENEFIQTERLTVPHPFMTERDFVMVPLAEIAPKLIIGGSFVEDLANAFDKEALIKISKR